MGMMITPRTAPGFTRRLLRQWPEPASALYPEILNLLTDLEGQFVGCADALTLETIYAYMVSLDYENAFDDLIIYRNALLSIRERSEMAKANATLLPLVGAEIERAKLGEFYVLSGSGAL